MQAKSRITRYIVVFKNARMLCAFNVYKLTRLTELLLQDVGQAVLESYSRVLEGLAFNIVAWIDDVLFVDNATRQQNK